jgi:hypothetical protein
VPAGGRRETELPMKIKTAIKAGKFKPEYT